MRSAFCAAVPAVCSALLLWAAGCAMPPAQSEYSQAQAQEDAFDAGANKPASTATVYGMSRVMAGQGRYEEQAALLRQVISRQKDYLPAYNDLAQLQLSRHDPQAAMTTVKSGLSVAPDDPVLANNAGMCLLFMRDFQGALDQFTTASRLAPRQGKYRANAALALSMLGRYDESLAMYKQVLRPSQAHYNLGVMHQARQQLLEALQEYDRARKLESGSALALSPLAVPPPPEPAAEIAAAPPPPSQPSTMPANGQSPQPQLFPTTQP